MFKSWTNKNKYLVLLIKLFLIIFEIPQKSTKINHTGLKDQRNYVVLKYLASRWLLIQMRPTQTDCLHSILTESARTIDIDRSTYSFSNHSFKNGVVFNSVAL